MYQLLTTFKFRSVRDSDFVGEQSYKTNGSAGMEHAWSSFQRNKLRNVFRKIRMTHLTTALYGTENNK